MEIIELGIKAALFDQQSALKLSHLISTNQLWTFKLSTTSFYISLFSALRPAQLKSHQFYLENMHRLPTTKQGWYLYHSRKNLVCIKEFIGKGIKNGVKYSLVTAFYSTCSNLCESMREKQDFVNSTVGGFVTGALWSTRVFKKQRLLCTGVGALSGLTIGLLEDLYYDLHGQSIKEFYLQQ